MPVRRGSSDHGPPLDERGLDVVVDVPGHAGQLAGGAEVADQRQVRVGGVAVTGRAAAARRPAGPRRPGSRPWSAGPRGADAEVPPPGCFSRDRLLPGEERVARVEHLRREHRHVPPVQRPDLVGGVPHGRGRRDDQRPDRRARRGAPGRQRVDGDLEQPDRGAERAGDQVQLVLDDQVRRPEPGDRVDRGGGLAVLAGACCRP